MAVYDVSTTEKKAAPSLVAGGTLYADSPIGAILPFGGTNPPSGFLLCQGQEVSKTTYAELYAVIGDSFGTASDATKFVIPDMREAVPKGAGLTGHTVGDHLDADGLAVGEFLDDRGELIKGDLGIRGINGGDGLGVIQPNPPFSIVKAGSNIGLSALSTNGQYTKVTFDSSAVARSGATTEVKSVGVNYIIKAKMVALPSDFLAKVDEAVEDVVKSGSLNLDGTIGPLAGKRFVVAFSTPMPDTDYSVALTMNSTSTYWANQQFSLSGKATTGFEFYIWNNEPSAAFDASSSKIDWIAKHN